MDYAKAKKAGYEFAILRVGCGSTKDKCFEKDYASAVAAGLKVGVYFYTYATTVTEAIQDATRVLGWLNNRHLDLPVYYDVEDAKQKGTSRKATNTNMFTAFAGKIKAKGYAVGLYTGEYFFNNYFNKAGIDTNLWIAKYSTKEPSVGKQIQMWQYTSGAVSDDFYTKKLDRSFYYGSFAETSDANGNPYPVPTRSLKKTVPIMTGNDVKWLQWELNKASASLDVDGKFGNKTKNAVLAYQKAHGLKQDAIVGPATRYSLLND